MATCDIWKTVVWERSNKIGKWCSYSAEVSQLLERSYMKNLHTVSLGDADVNLKIYTVNLKEFSQVSAVTGTKSPIRRRLSENSSSLGKGSLWQWQGGNRNTWHSYDVDVANFIEASYQQDEKFVDLSKKFPGYYYEIDLVNMMQRNKRTKRKRPIQRDANVRPYPVAKCSDEDTALAVPNKVQNTGLTDFPGIARLAQQAKDYLNSVMDSELLPTSKDKQKKIRSDHNREVETTDTSIESNTDEAIRNKPSLKEAKTTAALVNGIEWASPWPPYTPDSKLKPVPAIDFMPKIKKVKGKRGKKKVEAVPPSPDPSAPVNVLDYYVEEHKLSSENTEEKMCIICCEDLTECSSYSEDNAVAKLKLCSHVFHKACIEAMYNNGSKNYIQCPTCKKIHGEKHGIQPPGDMLYHVLPYSLPGYPECETIRIIYKISSGVQGPDHPNPGKKYSARGFPRHCYLPDNEEGRKVLRLLIKAWERRLVFTLGTSSTTGEENTVTWNEIHHKTEFGCNNRGHGYPDPNYLQNVMAELEAHGVVEETYNCQSA